MQEVLGVAIRDAIGLVGIGLSAVLGYFFGRRQEIDKLRLQAAFPRAERISTLIQEIHGIEAQLVRWWQSNLGHLETIDHGLAYFETSSLYEAKRQQILDLTQERGNLNSEIRTARVYLNQSDLDRIEKYLELGHFEYSHDGMGGIIFTNFWRAFWYTLLDDKKGEEREALFEKIKTRLNRMHELRSWWHPW